MFYTTEEAAIVCGFLNLYLDRASVDVSVRRRNAAFQLGAATETLQPEDYRWAEKVLHFLKPCWWQLHEDHRALENALLKTHLLAQRKKTRAAPVLVGSILLYPNMERPSPFLKFSFAQSYSTLLPGLSGG